MQVTSATIKHTTSAGIGGNLSAVQDSDEQLRSRSTIQQQRAEGPSPAVTISLSAAAVLHLAQTKSSSAQVAGEGYFAQFFLSREGYQTNALGAAVADPSNLSSSAGLSLEQTAVDARARMDAKYASMRQSGQPFTWQSIEQRDKNALFGDLDRRSLLAVRENVGGLFSKDEQKAASALMIQQQGMGMGMGMGLFAGQISMESKFHDPYGEDKVARFTAAVEWLGRVSVEEKRTGEWLQQYTAVIGSLRLARQQTEPPEREWYSLVDLLTLKDREQKEVEQLQGERQPPLATEPQNVSLNYAQQAYFKSA